MARFCARVRKRADLPSVSMKDIYRHPTIRSLAAALTDAAPAPVERILAAVLADVMHAERVPADSNFFDDLGADSLVMAQFCARARKRGDLPSVSMKDIYRHPTIRSLAAALTDAAPAPAESSVPATAGVGTPVSTLQYVVCGALQFLFYLGYAYCAGLVAFLGYKWISSGSGLIDFYLRSVAFGGASFLVLCTLPILAKWTLIGRWKPQQIRIWSLAYVRFWFVKTLVRSNPLALLFAGSPLYVLYLRALGAKVGRGVVIFSRQRARVHRPAHHRRRHGHPEGLVLPLLPSPGRPDPDRRGHPGPRRFHRRDDGARHRHLDGRRGPTGPLLLFARGAGCARRPMLARVPSRTDRGELPDGRGCRLRHPAKGRLLRPGTACHAGPVPAVGGRWPRRPAGVAPGQSADDLYRLHQLGVLPRRRFRLLRAFLRHRARRPSLRVHCPSRAQPGHQAGQGLSLVWPPILAPPGDRARDELEVLGGSVRRQLLHRPLSEPPRVRPFPGRADWVELRHGGQAREPVPKLCRHRNAGR